MFLKDDVMDFFSLIVIVLMVVAIIAVVGNILKNSRNAFGSNGDEFSRELVFLGASAHALLNHRALSKLPEGTVSELRLYHNDLNEKIAFSQKHLHRYLLESEKLMLITPAVIMYCNMLHYMKFELYRCGLASDEAFIEKINAFMGMVGNPKAFQNFLDMLFLNNREAANLRKEANRDSSLMRINSLKAMNILSKKVLSE